MGHHQKVNHFPGNLNLLRYRNVLISSKKSFGKKFNEIKKSFS